MYDKVPIVIIFRSTISTGQIFIDVWIWFGLFYVITTPMGYLKLPIFIAGTKIYCW